MQANRILDRHYTETIAACLRDEATDHHGALRANDCAALHIGLDAMARIQAKRKPQAGYVASYPPVARRDAEAVAHSLFSVLNRHVCGVMDAERRRVERLTLTMRADSVARHYMLAALG